MLGNTIFGSLLSQIPPVPFNSSVSASSVSSSSVSVLSTPTATMLPLTSVNSSLVHQTQQPVYMQPQPTTTQQQGQQAQHFHTLSQHPHAQFVVQPMQTMGHPGHPLQAVHLAPHPPHLLQHQQIPQGQSLTTLKTVPIMAHLPPGTFMSASGPVPPGTLQYASGMGSHLAVLQSQPQTMVSMVPVRTTALNLASPQQQQMQLNGTLAPSNASSSNPPASLTSLDTKPRMDTHMEQGDNPVTTTNSVKKDTGPYQCSLCSKSYRYRHGLKQHTQQVHFSKRGFTCVQCGTSFKRKQQLQQHVQSGHITPGTSTAPTLLNLDEAAAASKASGVSPGNTYHCPHCSNMFHSQEIFLLHLRTSHMKPPKNVTFLCELCQGLTFKNKTSLIRHRRKEHPDHEFPNIQSVRPVASSTYSDGDQATSVVSTEGATENSHPTGSTNGTSGPHVCSTCGKRFLNRYGLRRHERIHTGERPHECEVCGLCFMEKSHMKQHQMTHTGETLFHCDVCKRGFNRKYSYQRHLLWHAKGIALPPEEQERLLHEEMVQGQEVQHMESHYQSDSAHPQVKQEMVIDGGYSNVYSLDVGGGSFTMQLAADTN